MEQVLPVGATHLSAGAELRQVAETVAGGEEEERKEGWGAPGEEKKEQRGGEEARKGQKRRGEELETRTETRSASSAAPCRRQVRSSFPSESVVASFAVSPCSRRNISFHSSVPGLKPVPNNTFTHLQFVS